MKFNELVAITFATAGVVTCSPTTHADNLACAASCIAEKVQARTTASPISRGINKKLDRVIPQGFSSYANEAISKNDQCVVGAVVDDDGLNQKPFMYLIDAKTKHVAWSKAFDIPVNTYQSRVTHCLESDGRLFVLLQSDTQSEQTLSQTLLRVERIRLDDGSLEAVKDISLPGVNDAYSAWVDEGSAAFNTKKGDILVRGHYYRLTDPTTHLSFEIAIEDNLRN